MARPKKETEERRDLQRKLRLTAAEDNALEVRAGAVGLTVSEFLRRRGLAYRLPANLAAQQQRAAAATALIRLGVNLNQIARQMNAGGGAPPELAALIERVNAELDRLYASEA